MKADSDFVCQGRWVGLRIPSLEDQQAIFVLSTSGPQLAHYSHRATMPNGDPAGHRGSLLQLAVVPLDQQASGVVGVASCYGQDFRNRWAKLAYIGRPEQAESARGADGFVTFVTYLFQQFDFRKLYADVLAPNLPQFRSLVERGPFDVEGTLKGHEFVDGRYHDLHILAVTADNWQPYAQRVHAVIDEGWP